MPGKKYKEEKQPGMPNNWRQSSLESLENHTWRPPTYPSFLVTRCHELRKKPLDQFEVEDLRIMIGQNIGLRFLVPLAIEVLTENIFAEGDFYEGDLLQSVMTAEPSFWNGHEDHWGQIKQLITLHLSGIRKRNITIPVNFI